MKRKLLFIIVMVFILYSINALSSPSDNPEDYLLFMNGDIMHNGSFTDTCTDGDLLTVHGWVASSGPAFVCDDDANKIGNMSLSGVGDGTERVTGWFFNGSTLKDVSCRWTELPDLADADRDFAIYVFDGGAGIMGWEGSWSVGSGSETHFMYDTDDISPTSTGKLFTQIMNFSFEAGQNYMAWYANGSLMVNDTNEAGVNSIRLRQADGSGTTDSQFDDIRCWDGTLQDEPQMALPPSITDNNLSINISLFLNVTKQEDITITDSEPFRVHFTANTTLAIINLTRNGTPIANNSIQNLVVGYYNFTASINDTTIANFTNVTYFANVIPSADNNLSVNFSLFLNNTEKDIILTLGETFSVHYLSNVSFIFALTRNGTAIENNSNQNLGVGVYNFTISTNGTIANFSNLTRFAEVTADIVLPEVNTSINNTASRISEIVNISANVSDKVGLSFCQIINNQTGINVINNVSVSGTSDECSSAFTISVGKGNVINLSVRVNDSSNNFKTNDTIITVINTIPTPATIIFPTADLRTNVQPNLSINVTFDLDVDGDEITIYYYINNTLNQTSLINVTFNASDNKYNLSVSLFDGEDFSANVSVLFEIDTINPIINIETPADATTHSSNISVNITCIDINPFILNYTFFNDTSQLVKTIQNSSSINNELGIRDIIDISDLPDGDYILNVSCSDSHTKKAIPDYEITKNQGQKSLKYKLQDFNNVTIRLIGDQMTNIDDFNTFKSTDRYVFWYDFNNIYDGTIYTYTFIVLAQGTSLTYLENSEYKAHFVTKENWIDFEFEGNEDAVYTVTDIGQNYLVDIETNKTYLEFRSIGGLNIATEEQTLTIDTSIAPAITGLVVLPLENVTNIAGMIVLFFIVIGGALAIFKKSKSN